MSMSLHWSQNFKTKKKKKTKTKKTLLLNEMLVESTEKKISGLKKFFTFIHTFLHG